MKTIVLTAQMVDAAVQLGEGPLLVVYLDGSALRCETERGRDPYVWRGGRWHPMRGDQR